MTFPANTRLGPYEIQAPLGAGGMGEVYRARDSRLGREVAIKVLPQALSSDPERLKRFEKEARAASALNHPNIVTVYDVGLQEGVSYLAMELVSGETLRTLVSGGPMPIKKLLAIAPQIAEGLSKAHEAGIVHRDLKPENVMVTKDGLVKILDFGLAKLTSTMSGSDEGSNLPTMTGTTPGVVVGTVGYMSPEQASGQTVDFRSDQFSFGSILYEMATGRRAFQRKTAIDTLGAILNDEPDPIATVSPQTPAPLRWIAQRCLEKDRDSRYASTRDLARDLAGLRDRLSETTSGAIAPDDPSRISVWKRGLVLAAAGVAACVLGIAADRWWASRHPDLAVPALKQLTFRRGNVVSARFAPDGRTVVYGAAWDGQAAEIYTVRTDSTESRPLGLTHAVPAAVSSKGELAVLLKKDNDLWGGKGTLARVPLGGGTPRELLEDVWNADWAPNGEDLAVVKDSKSGGREIQYPIGKVLATGSDLAGACRVAPDGQHVATMVGSDIVVLDRKGRRTVVSRGWRGVNEWVWSPAGDEIIFLGTRAEDSLSVYAVSLSGRERILVSNMASFVCLYDIAADGRLLLELSYQRDGTTFRSRGQSLEKEWLPSSWPVAMSADGSRLLLNDGQWRPTDGSPPARLSDGIAVDLSADGRWALMIKEGPPRELTLVPTGTGVARKIPLGGVEPQWARLLPTGGFLVVSVAAGGAASVGTVGPDGGSVKRLPASDRIREQYWGGISVAVSPRADVIAYVDKDGRIQVDPLTGGSGSIVPGISLDKNDGVIQWSEDGRFLYVVRVGEIPISVDRVEVATGRRESWKKLAPEDRAGLTIIGSMWLSPNGENYAYGYPRVVASDLYTMSGVK